MYLSARDVQTNKCVCPLDSPISGSKPECHQVLRNPSSHYLESRSILSHSSSRRHCLAPLPQCTDKRRRLLGSQGRRGHTCPITYCNLAHSARRGHECESRTLKGQQMYDFLNSSTHPSNLSSREFPRLAMPTSSSSEKSASMASGGG